MRNFTVVKIAARLLTPVAIAVGTNPARGRIASCAGIAVADRTDRVCWLESASTVISRAIVYISVILSASEAVSSQSARFNRAFRNEQSIGELPCEDQR
jgi:hypothetical protein